MITRPLDLASRLQPDPRSFDALFYINVGLVALFFMIFGSRFVLPPGVELPVIAGAQANAIRTTATLKVRASGELLTDNGLLTEKQLPQWLKDQAARSKHPALLIVADTRAAAGELSHIVTLAHSAGFPQTIWAAEAVTSDVQGP